MDLALTFAFGAMIPILVKLFYFSFFAPTHLEKSIVLFSNLGRPKLSADAFLSDPMALPDTL